MQIAPIPDTGLCFGVSFGRKGRLTKCVFLIDWAGRVWVVQSPMGMSLTTPPHARHLFFVRLSAGCFGLINYRTYVLVCQYVVYVLAFSFVGGLARELIRNCGGGGCFLCWGSGQFAKASEALEEGFARSASFAIQDANCPDPRHRIFGWDKDC
jgi:hypothetical protein